MPKLVNLTSAGAFEPGTPCCFRCKSRDVETPATHIVFFDDSVGVFAGEYPRLCQGHADEIREMNRDQRKVVFRGFPIMPPPTPCRPFPDEATYKTVGLAPCPKCKTADCWEHYLSWEKYTGVTLNESEHPVQDDWLERNGLARTN